MRRPTMPPPRVGATTTPRDSSMSFEVVVRYILKIGD
jgi:hypothetical protein